MSPVRTSRVWKYFEELTNEDHTVLCRICGKRLKFHSSTSNMKAHLKAKHTIEFNSLTDEGDESNYNEPTDYEIIDVASVLNPSSTSTPMSVLVNSGSVSGSQNKEKEILSYQKLVVPVSMRSVYWKCYGFPASADGEILSRLKIVCLLCKTVISYNRNTSNLRCHLQNRHANELQQLEASRPAPRDPNYKPKKSHYSKKKEGNLYTTEADGSLTIGAKYSQTRHTPHSTSTMSGTSGANNTPTIEGIESLHPFMIPVEPKNVCDAIAEFVVIDMQLPDIVEGRGFQRLIATLRSPCEIPSKVKLVDEVIPRLYDTMKETVIQTIQQIKTEVALTVEEWETACGETYVTFSICYQQEKDDNLYSKVIATAHSPLHVDSAYWNLILDNLLGEWSIKLDKITAVVCGTVRPELMEAILHKGLIVLPCLVQTLQEVCTRVCFDQEDVKEILLKCRALIHTIYKNSSALAALRIQDHLMMLEETPLTSDYPKVWISTYLMMEALLARRQVIPSILDNVENSTYDRDLVTLHDQEWSLMEDVVSVLEPFKVTLMTLSEEKAPLVSLLKPLLSQLLTCHLKPKEEGESVNSQIFKDAMKTLLSDKYSDNTVNQLLLVATALDPRFKSLPSMADDVKNTLEGPIKDALATLIQENPQSEMVKAPEVTSEPDKKKPKLLGMVMLLGELCPPTKTDVLNNVERANLEMVQYQSENTAPLDQCPVAWWHRTTAKCPYMARLAGQYTCVPATAIPAFRIPVETQISYETKRANLSPEIVDRVIFLNSHST